MKVKRFVTEYANYKINLLYKRETLDKTAEAIRRIDNAVRMCEAGLLTIEETIRIINEV